MTLLGGGGTRPSESEGDSVREGGTEEEGDEMVTICFFFLDCVMDRTLCAFGAIGLGVEVDWREGNAPACFFFSSASLSLRFSCFWISVAS